MITSRRRQQRARGRVAEPVDLVVDRRVLLDVRVGRREVRLGLVVVVVGDEVLDPVLREQLAELARELRGEALVRRQHERRPLGLGDHAGDRERLARPGDAEQRLELVAPLDPGDQGRDRLGLVARGREIGDELEVGHPVDAYRRGVTVNPVRVPRRVRSAFSARPAAESSAQTASTWRFEVREVAGVVEHPGRDRAALLVGGLRAMRRSASSRGMPRGLEPVEPQLLGRLDDDHRARSWSAALATRRAAARRGRRSRRPAPRRTWRRNSSPIAGCVIASRSLRVRRRRTPAPRARPGRATPSACRISAPNRSTSFASAGVPGSTTCRAMRSASTTTAPARRRATRPRSTSPTRSRRSTPPSTPRGG